MDALDWSSNFNQWLCSLLLSLECVCLALLATKKWHLIYVEIVKIRTSQQYQNKIVLLCTANRAGQFIAFVFVVC